ncbi:TPA: GGDEF domain-containing protein [Legionella anisa]
MEQRTVDSLRIERFLYLLKGTLRSIPFNSVGAGFLSLAFLYNQGLSLRVLFWFFLISLLSLGRWLYNRIVIAKKSYQSHFELTRSLFLVFIFLTGLAWGSAFFIFPPGINVTEQAIIALVLGGMAAGAIAALSGYLPSFYAYVVPMFLPIILYDFYSLTPNKVIIGVLYCMFLALVFLTAQTNAQLLTNSFKYGHEKDILINELTLMNLRLEKSIEEIKTLSITDSLTGLYNRRHFDALLYNELKTAQHHHYPIHLVLIDIDNFKFINDTYGHPSGDDFLIYVANTLKNATKCASDMIFRLGGDEFALIVSHSVPHDVLYFCNALQDRFSQSNRHKQVTLSIGIISVVSFKSLDKEAVIHAADRTLYQAKKDGKNKIIAEVISEV